MVLCISFLPFQIFLASLHVFCGLKQLWTISCDVMSCRWCFRRLGYWALCTCHLVKKSLHECRITWQVMWQHKPTFEDLRFHVLFLVLVAALSSFRCFTHVTPAMKGYMCSFYDLKLCDVHHSCHGVTAFHSWGGTVTCGGKLELQQPFHVLIESWLQTFLQSQVFAVKLIQRHILINGF